MYSRKQVQHKKNTLIMFLLPRIQHVGVRCIADRGATSVRFSSGQGGSNFCRGGSNFYGGGFNFYRGTSNFYGEESKFYNGESNFYGGETNFYGGGVGGAARVVRGT